MAAPSPTSSPNLVETEQLPAKYTVPVLAADCFTSAVVALSIAAPVTIIDYSIMMKVGGVSPSIRHGLKEGFTTLFLRPHHFFLRNPHNQYALIYRVVAVVYGLTYLSSNIAKDFMEARGYGTGEINWARGIISGGVNTVLTVFKDSFILRNLPMASTGAPAPKYVPMLSRFGFCVRDVVTCVAAFTLVPMFAKWLDSSSERRAMIPDGVSTSTVSSMSVPAVVQIGTAVIHIAAIRYQRTYPNPSWADITRSIKADYWGTIAARMARIIPAYGIGGIGNAKLLDTTTSWARQLDRKLERQQTRAVL